MNKLIKGLLGLTRFLAGWVVAVLFTTALACVLQTQNVLARLGNIGADIGFGDRLAMTGYDLFRFGSLYIIFIAIGLLIAFLVGLLVFHVARFGRPIVFAVAGGVAMAVMLFAMKNLFFGVQLVAGARDMTGFLMQILAGVIGGLIFAGLTRPGAGVFSARVTGVADA